MTDKSVKLILPSQIALHDLSISLEYDTPGIMVSVVFLCDKRPLTVHKTFQILIQDSDNLSDGEPGVRTVKQEELEGSLVSKFHSIRLWNAIDTIPIWKHAPRDLEKPDESHYS